MARSFDNAQVDRIPLLPNKLPKCQQRHLAVEGFPRFVFSYANLLNQKFSFGYYHSQPIYTSSLTSKLKQ